MQCQCAPRTEAPPATPRPARQRIMCQVGCTHTAAHGVCCMLPNASALLSSPATQHDCHSCADCCAAARERMAALQTPRFALQPLHATNASTQHTAHTHVHALIDSTFQRSTSSSTSFPSAEITHTFATSCSSALQHKQIRLCPTLRSCYTVLAICCMTQARRTR